MITGITERQEGIHKAIAQNYKFTMENDTQARACMHTYIGTHRPQAVLQNDDVKLYWDKTIQTDHTITNNRSDVTLIDKINETTHLIEINTLIDDNVIKKQQEKIEKHVPLAREITKI